MSKKYSSDDNLQKLFEGFRKFTKEEEKGKVNELFGMFGGKKGEEEPAKPEEPYKKLYAQDALAKMILDDNIFDIKSIQYYYSIRRDDNPRNRRIYPYSSYLQVTLYTSLGKVVVTKSRERDAEEMDGDLYFGDLLYRPILDLRQSLPKAMIQKFGDKLQALLDGVKTSTMPEYSQVREYEMGEILEAKMRDVLSDKEPRISVQSNRKKGDRWNGYATIEYGKKEFYAEIENGHKNMIAGLKNPQGFRAEIERRTKEYDDARALAADRSAKGIKVPEF